MIPLGPAFGIPPRVPAEPSPRTAALIARAPVVLALVCAAVFYSARLHPLHTSLLGENHPIELLTLAALLVAGACGLRWVWKARGWERGALVRGFVTVFSIGLLLAAMEEISWGQWFSRFATPPWLNAINAQHEFTLHNIRGLQNHTEYLRLAFGLGGLAGVWALRSRRLRGIAAPRALLPWFLVISALSALDAYSEWRPFAPRVNRMLWGLSEVVEMMIGISALLYVWLGARRMEAERAAERGRAHRPELRIVPLPAQRKNPAA